MKITEQQLIVLFDIAKGCLYQSDKQFAGYSKEEIMKLLNDIIKQQDNTNFVELSIDSEKKIIDNNLDSDNIFDEPIDEPKIDLEKFNTLMDDKNIEIETDDFW